jgi:hypothetical protein
LNLKTKPTATRLQWNFLCPIGGTSRVVCLIVPPIMIKYPHDFVSAAQNRVGPRKKDMSDLLKLKIIDRIF